MASMVGEYFSAPTQLHTMIATTALHHQQSRESAHYLSNCSTREPATDRRSSSSPRYRSHHAPHHPAPPRSAPEVIPLRDIATAPCEPQPAPKSSASPTGGASRFPSPPSSSSPKAADSAPGQTHDVPCDPPMPQLTREAPTTGTTTTMPPDARSSSSSAPAYQQPSPSSETGLPVQQHNLEQPAPREPYPAHDGQDATSTPQGKTVHVRDLSHIRSLARADLIAGNETGPLGDDAALHHMKYDISGMPIADVIEMVAALLTKITSTNDLQHDAIQRNVTHQQQAVHGGGEDPSSRMSPLSSSVLAFHGKNVPSITILSYLSRIHRYCPTTYEVFLSLLVYFDRMTERVNDLVVRSEEERRREALRGAAVTTTTTSNGTRRSSASLESRMRDAVMRDVGDAMDSDPDIVDDDDDDDMTDGAASSSRAESEVVMQPATYFVVDSFNIHRLIIAGVTCASKFFSDVFYTNSRYAKVGGLPLPELNHLELQFLLLNDFQLFVPVEDLEAYATMLVEFYAREIVVQAPAEE